MRNLALILCVAGAAVVAPAGAQIAVPPTLTGETLTGVPTVTFSCNPELSTISFSVSGVAAGPYPGTFSETGSTTVGATELFGVGPVTFDATFTIESGTTVVTGTKRLAVPTQSNTTFGFCFSFFGTHVHVQADALAYDARISTPSGAFVDRGTSTVSLGAECQFSCQTGFAESFTSALTAPEAELPQTAEACKDGGWERFPVFKNQGDCVSFVETAGRNEPGQNLPG
jgi:hypothetical protein